MEHFLRTAMLQNNLFQRIASALILVPLALSAVYWGGYGFSALMLGVALVMGWEWSKLYGLTIRGGGVSLVLLLGCGAIVVLALLDKPGLAIWALPPFALALLAISQMQKAKFKNIPYQIFWLGAFYICLPIIAFSWIRLSHAEGLYLSVWLLAVVWSMDTGAFFVGKSVGGAKLLPAVSPNKTWSGLIGGAVIAGLVAFIVGNWLDIQSIPHYFLVGFLLALFSQGGDLLESYIKRKAGVKDSSQIIPGHGGVMDRIDALIAGVAFLGAVLLISERIM